MRDFLKKILLFIAIPLAIILISDYALRMQNTLYKEKYEGAKKAKDSIEVLLLGTSHVTYGVDPQAFDLYAYNLSNLAQSIYFDKRITLSLLPELSNLKYVFISIGYHSFAFSSQFNRDFWSYYGNGVKYEGTNYFFANLSPTLFGYTPKVSYAMLKRKIINRWKYGTEIIDFEVQGGVNLYKQAVKGFIAFEGRDTTNFNPDAYDFLSSTYTEIIDQSDEKEEILNDLEDFIQILQAKDITPILITPPNYKRYVEYLNKSYVNGNVDASNRIAAKYNIKYWNFLDSDRFYIDDFYDMEHLNRKGAIKFSAMLNDSINKIERESLLVNHSSLDSN
ncbi:MAG: hypothetical protein PHI32_02785 [Dysgonamonadaceae bacterium]|nr:hypothetical protein [Dysgonamonadaceae bacterium]MDD4729528.1 hypothetical protein [Dysgonamonadaceae bacterium]